MTDTPTKSWCKILPCAKFGQALVTREWDDNEDCETIAIEVRSRFVSTLSFKFGEDAEQADRAFALIDETNIDGMLGGAMPDSLAALIV